MTTMSAAAPPARSTNRRRICGEFSLSSAPPIGTIQPRSLPSITLLAHICSEPRFDARIMPLSGVDIHFECTRCGKCCRDSRLPLTVAEALTWLEDRHDVQVLCEATPWLEEPSLDDAQGQHR